MTPQSRVRVMVVEVSLVVWQLLVHIIASAPRLVTASARMGGINVSLPLDLIAPRSLRLVQGEGE